MKKMQKMSNIFTNFRKQKQKLKEKQKTDYMQINKRK